MFQVSLYLNFDKHSLVVSEIYIRKQLIFLKQYVYKHINCVKTYNTRYIKLNSQFTACSGKDSVIDALTKHIMANQNSPTHRY